MAKTFKDKYTMTKSDKKAVKVYRDDRKQSRGKKWVHIDG